jgi:hypothetical protein
MRLLSTVGIIVMMAVSASAMAAENKQKTDKNTEFTEIFSPKTNSSATKPANYSDEFLLKSSSNTWDDKKESFQFKSEKDAHYKLSAHDESKSHGNKKNEHSHLDDHYGQNEGHDDWGHGGGHDGDWDDDGHHGDWDDDDIKSPVPEPETYALLLAGLLMLGAVKRRKN